jgi:hypothetical protein
MITANAEAAARVRDTLVAHVEDGRGLAWSWEKTA